MIGFEFCSVNTHMHGYSEYLIVHNFIR